jgi:hypothetical protein
MASDRRERGHPTKSLRGAKRRSNLFNKFLQIATSLPATLRSRLRLLLAMTLLLLRLY